ncbi:MAG: hypothetical protein KGK16_05260, partial [Bradyrhizobium sp.]|nr:hypothetical protein [Bradyrhizobium sp.]
KAEKSVEKRLEQPQDKQAETASIATDTHRHPREKTPVRVIPLTATAPVVQSAAAPAPTVEAAIAPDEYRDANDLARAAIQRLRGGSEASPHAQDTIIRAPEAGPAPRAASAPQAPVPQAAAVRPLPPPIMVSTPPADSPGSGSSSTQPYPATARVDDPRRPIPPADIPPAAPSELRAQPVDASAQPHTNVAEDMLLAAKSVFHAVLPQ